MDLKKIGYKEVNEIAYITFGDSESNRPTTIGREEFDDFDKILEHLEDKTGLQGVILHSVKKGVFLAGADINIFDTFKDSADATKLAADGQALFNRLADLKLPTIALVDGVCFGGGLELVLCCNYILCSDSNKTLFSLPEVKLGLIPGLGGTYRLPKKVGLPTALDWILSGKNIRAKKAKRAGLVDEVFPAENLIPMALKWLNGKKKVKKFSSLLVDNPISKRVIFNKTKEVILKKTKGFYQAPLKILSVMDKGSSASRRKYLSMESKAFGELCFSEQSSFFRELFFLHEKSKKYPGDKSIASKKFQSGAVLGAGTMGGGLAWLMAKGGIAPIVKDLTPEALDLGLKHSASMFGSMLKRRQITRDEFNRYQRNITGQLDYSGFKSRDFIIEAIVEDLDIKKAVFKELEREISDDCVVVSNTSALPITEMAESFEKPERFLGLHFFNPVNKMPLVEVITHPGTSEECTKSVYDWCVKNKKVPIVVKDAPGFLVNRILVAYINEAIHLLEEGVPVSEVDKVAVNFGLPMGPCRLLDEVGIDVGLKVGKFVHSRLGNRFSMAPLGMKIVESGLLGLRSKKGFYLYDEKGKSKGINPEILALLPSKKISMSSSDIQQRLILPMVNEAAHVLKEGIVDGPSVVDLGMIFGTGFPPFRGGLLKYADNEGLEFIVKSLEELAVKVDKSRFEVAPYLKELVASGKRFYQ